MAKVVYSGSFDVITLGHCWMVQEGSRLFDEIVVLVSVNADKKHSLSFEDRLRLAKIIFEPLGKNVKVEGLENEFAVHYATRNGAQYLLRGIRSNLDYEYEANIANINHDLAEDKQINSVFLMPPPTLKSMSSSMVRGLIGFKGWEHAIEQYVPEAMAEELYYRYSGIANLRVDYLFKKYNINYPSSSLMADYNDSSLIHYHNWKHIEECIEQFARVKEHLQYPDAVEMAIYFHDVVYNVKTDDSEERSAQFFFNSAMQSDDADFKHLVCEIIRNTKWTGNRYPVFLEGDMRFVHDIDFSIFSASWERFLEYDISIEKEYAGVATLEEFKAGRSHFLNQMIGWQKAIYETDYFNKATARRNIDRLLKERYS